MGRCDSVLVRIGQNRFVIMNPNNPYRVEMDHLFPLRTHCTPSRPALPDPCLPPCSKKRGDNVEKEEEPDNGKEEEEPYEEEEDRTLMPRRKRSRATLRRRKSQAAPRRRSLDGVKDYV